MTKAYFFGFVATFVAIGYLACGAYIMASPWLILSVVFFWPNR